MALMNDAAPAAAPAPSMGFKNPLLGQAEKQLEATLTPQNKTDYMKFVVAGMKVVTSGGPGGMISKLTNSRDPMATATAGPVNLVLMLAKNAQGKPPGKAMIPAAMTLMFHALDILDSTGKMKVDEGVLVEATKRFADNIMRAFNVSQAQLDEVSNRAQQITSNPAAMEKVHQHAAAIGRAGGVIPARPAPAAPAGAPSLMNQ